MNIRRMDQTELKRIADIDRSERVTLGYKVCGDRLVSEPVDWRVPRWPGDPDNDWGYPARIRRLSTLLDDGGVVLGAWDGERLAGFASLRYRLTETMAQLHGLFVSREYRRQGVASRLIEEIRRLAKEDGASALYVSGTPSESAVGFYLRQGFRPVDKPHPELLALEPDDIHMVMPLVSRKS